MNFLTWSQIFNSDPITIVTTDAMLKLVETSDEASAPGRRGQENKEMWQSKANHHWRWGKCNPERSESKVWESSGSESSRETRFQRGQSPVPRVQRVPESRNQSSNWPLSRIVINFPLSSVSMQYNLYTAYPLFIVVEIKHIENIVKNDIL